MGYSFRLAARVLLYASSHRQDNTYHGLCYTSHGALVGMRNSSMGPPWRIDPMTHRTMNEYSYHGATSRSLNHEMLYFNWLIMWKRFVVTILMGGMWVDTLFLPILVTDGKWFGAAVVRFIQLTRYNYNFLILFIWTILTALLYLTGDISLRERMLSVFKWKTNVWVVQSKN